MKQREYNICMFTMEFANVQVWLLTLVVLPARANIVVRLGLVVCTALLSISVLPRQVWMVSPIISLTSLFLSGFLCLECCNE